MKKMFDKMNHKWNPNYSYSYNANLVFPNEREKDFAASLRSNSQMDSHLLKMYNNQIRKIRIGNVRSL